MVAEYDAPTSGELPGAALNASTLWWGLLFGSIGLGFFVYGRKQRAIVPLVCGIGLMVFPYFVSGTAWLIIVGVVLVAIPRFVSL
ncbi:Amino acid transport protein [Rhodanobacter sp. Root179]